MSTLLECLRHHSCHTFHQQTPSVGFISSTNQLQVASIQRFITQTIVDMSITRKFFFVSFLNQSLNLLLDFFFFLFSFFFVNREAQDVLQETKQQFTFHRLTVIHINPIEKKVIATEHQVDSLSLERVFTYDICTLALGSSPQHLLTTNASRSRIKKGKDAFYTSDSSYIDYKEEDEHDRILVLRDNKVRTKGKKKCFSEYL